MPHHALNMRAKEEITGSGCLHLSKTKNSGRKTFLLIFLLFGMHDLLPFCEANSTGRNDISCKKLLNRPICIEVNKSALFRVLH